MKDEFAAMLKANEYPECLIKLTPPERTEFEAGLESTLKTWNVAVPAMLDTTLRIMAAATLSDRLDVVKIFMEEFADKTVEVNRRMEQRIFGAESNTALTALKASVADIVETTKRYQKGLPEGYCKVLLAMTSDTFILTMRALECDYMANADIVRHATKLTKFDQREILDEYSTRAKDSWDNLVTRIRAQLNEPVVPRIMSICRHETKTFEWLRREGMDIKPALDMATKAGQKYVAQFSFTAWFKDEEH